MTALRRPTETTASTPPRAHSISDSREVPRVLPLLAPLGVTLLASVLYAYNLAVSGFANTYYAAAALAASQSWSAWFFGSLDASNFITVDKPPLATMLMGLSVRLFGLNSWSILLPEALCGIASVLVLFAIVRRQFGTAAATIAGIVMALTPAAMLIFRYNNPDALLTFLLVLAAGTFLRGLEDGRVRWIVATAVLVGFAFNTKYLQAYLVVPAFVLTYFVASPGSVRRRVATLLVALVTLIFASGWWVLAVELIPAANRPYIGGSTNNSALQLLLGYDGLGRIFGGQGPGSGTTDLGGAASGGAGGFGGAFGGAAGIGRMLNADFGGEIAWFLPLAAIALVAGLLLRFRARRTDVPRAAYLMWGLWLLVHGLVFSFMSGIIHSYYVVVMVPAIAALVGAGSVDLWRLRSRGRLGAVPLAVAIVASAGMAAYLLARTPTFVPGLWVVVLAGGIAAAAVIALPMPRLGRVQLLAAAVAAVVLLAGPAAYAADAVNTAFSGGDPSLGPQVQTAESHAGGFPGGPPNAGDRTPPGGIGNAGGADGGFGPNGAVDTTANSALVQYLLANEGDARWIVATESAQSASTIELASGKPVMAMGGFSGSDPAPTLDQLKTLVKSRALRYVLIGGGGPGGGGPGGGGPGGSTSGIAAWVRSAGTVVQYGGSGGTLYDLSTAVGG